MMPQKDVDHLLPDPQEQTYGGYEGNQVSAHQHSLSSYEQSGHEDAGGKVYPVVHDNKNLYRLLVFVVAMVVLLLFAVLTIFFIGGTGGWVSLIVIAFIIFLICAVVVSEIR
jgi:Mg2+/Co2+ transporter CorB